MDLREGEGKYQHSASFFFFLKEGNEACLRCFLLPASLSDELTYTRGLAASMVFSGDVNKAESC